MFGKKFITIQPMVHSRRDIESTENIELDETYNWWLDFRDRELQNSFQNFRSSEFSSVQLAVISIFFTFIAVMSILQSTVAFDNLLNNNQHRFATYLKFLSTILFILLVVLPLWLTVYLKLRNENYNNIFKDFSIIIGANLCTGTTAIAIALGADVHGTFTESAILLVMIPSVMANLFRHTSLKILFLGWLTSFLSLITAYILANKEGFFIFIAPLLLAYQGYYMEYRSLNHFLNEVNRSRLSTKVLKLEEQKDSKFVDDLRHMIGNVAHDLKTPTQSFSVCLEQLENSINAASVALHTSNYQKIFVGIFDEMSDNVLQLKASNTFMSMMINRTIDFTKASHGKTLSPRMTTVDIMEALSWPLNCIKCMQDKIPIVVEAFPSGLCKHIITDVEWIQENLLCLISNAFKYSVGGRIDVRVLFPATSSRHLDGITEQMIRFEVEDQGIGVPEEMRQRLFAPFRQAQRLAGGTGLGLYSMLKRMEALKGTCGVQGRRDGQEGSLFWFEIPYRPDPSHNVIKLNSYDQSDGGEVVMVENDDLGRDDNSTVDNSLKISSLKMLPKNLKILLVDDSLPILKTLGMALKKEGHSVQTASNGAEALIYLINKQEEFDFVIMDLQMPVMDGIEAVRRLRAYESTKREESIYPDQFRQIVIGSSANSDDVTRKEALEVGMDDFLPKPYPVSVLIQVISKKYRERERSTGIICIG